MSTTESGPDVPQPAEAQSAEVPEQQQAPAARSRGDRALDWAQVGLAAVCVGTGTVVGLTGHSELGTAIAVSGSSIHVALNIERK
ncbi:hypothetical protein [Streptomyces sp. NPDC053560]|uniref:hypothetical protein n=1 Tax=Streptomyces sp. NPDC053560 TaxID=3365711 RepID=UPI0037CD51D3